MPARSFFDSNILVYTDDHDEPGKQARALELVAEARIAGITLCDMGLSTTIGADGAVRIDAPSGLPPGPGEAVVVVHPVTEPVRSALHWRDSRGLGKEIWRGIDAQTYLNELRDEWAR